MVSPHISKTSEDAAGAVTRVRIVFGALVPAGLWLTFAG
jgi:hypothetical protein